MKLKLKLQGNAKKPAKDIGEILKKVSANPKTVKQRLQNVEALNNYNEDHEDDVFDEPVKSGSSGSLKTSTKSTLLSQDPDSDSDMDVSIHSARTPITGQTQPSYLQSQSTFYLFQHTLVKGVLEISRRIKLLRLPLLSLISITDQS